MLNDAGTLSGPLLSDGKIDATYCFEGTQATTWSLGTSGTNTLLATDPIGSPVPVGSTVVNRASDAMTLVVPGAGSVTCATTTASLTPSFLMVAPVGPAVFGTYTGLTFNSCTDTVFGLSYPSCANAPGTFPAVKLRASAAGGTEIIGQTYLRCPAFGTGSSCYMTFPSATGAITTSTTTIGFTNVPVTLGAPPGATDALAGGLCAGGGTLSFRLTGLTSTTGGTTVTLRTV